MGTSPSSHATRDARCSAKQPRLSLRPTRPEVQPVRPALRRAPWPPYWERASPPLAFAVSAATPPWRTL